MNRSFFLVFATRLTVMMGVAVAGCLVIPRGMWPGDVVVVAVCALVAAVWLSRSLRTALIPLQRSLAAGAVRGKAVPAGLYADVNDLGDAVQRAFMRADAAFAASVEARQELEAMLDSMQDAVVAVDSAGRIQWTNQNLQRLVPGASFSSAIRIGHALVQTIRDPEVLDCVRVALQERQISERRSTSLIPGRIFEVSAAPMPGGGAVAVFHDITRMEQMERTQRDFVANVSHELRTPLTSITGYVETLLDHEASLSSQARDFLSTILKNATRMNRLTEELLVMARVEAQEQKLNLTPISADALVRDAVKAMSGLVKDAAAVLEIGTVTDCEVLADTDATLQVLSNLIENAIKYGRPKNAAQVRIVLSAREVEDPAFAGVSLVEFSVRDFGQGIASEHLARIFERFYRVDKARSRESGGTGLGLAIAQHMVQAQGGSIRAESELNQGTTFLFTLPKAGDVPQIKRV